MAKKEAGAAGRGPARNLDFILAQGTESGSQAGL